MAVKVDKYVNTGLITQAVAMLGSLAASTFIQSQLRERLPEGNVIRKYRTEATGVGLFVAGSTMMSGKRREVRQAGAVIGAAGAATTLWGVLSRMGLIPSDFRLFGAGAAVPVEVIRNGNAVSSLPVANSGNDHPINLRETLITF